MGFISRKLLPACGNMCVCCPTLNPSSRRPVKRYKKLLTEIFPKHLDGASNERKIMKLCEYAAKNPLRIPKIAKILEQRSYKELRSDHVNFVKIIMEAYSKLLYICKEQMAYFAISLLNVMAELVDNKQPESMQILGCQTLTRFIYSQADNTYSRTIENLVHKVLLLACEHDARERRILRASSLQCLSAIIWFMSKYSCVFMDVDEIIYVILDNYRTDEDIDGNGRSEIHHNWVDEVVRSETIGGVVIANDVSPSNTVIKRLEAKDSSLLTREERESPEVWSQICIQKLADLANETTTMRRVLEPMFVYFDQGRHWSTRSGLALLVLSSISYAERSLGNEQLILAAVIRHLDNKNVVNNLHIKADIVQVATSFVRQLRSRTMISEVGVISDLCRHLRKSLQATVESVTLLESNLNNSFQSSIEDCLLEIIKTVADKHLLFDMMAITLEKLSDNDSVSRATIGSLLILAHICSTTSVYNHSEVFPEALLVQLLKTMMHSDFETRAVAHQIFSVVLGRSLNHTKYELETKKWQSRTTSVFASATALLEKLRKEKEGVNVDKLGTSTQEEGKFKQMDDEVPKHCWSRKSSPYFSKLTSSIIDRIAKYANFPDKDTSAVSLTEDQIAQMLYAFWLQAHRADNKPSDYEAIAHSFSLTLISSRLKIPNQINIVRAFQLLLSLRNTSLDPDSMLPPSCQRSLFTLANGLLAFATKIYHISSLTDLLVLSEVDPYLKVDEELHIFVRSDVEDYGSGTDQQAAKTTLSNLRNTIYDYDHRLLDVLCHELSSLTGLEKDVLAKQLTETFIPEDISLFGLNPAFDWVNLEAPAVSEESITFDEERSRTSSVADDACSHSPAVDIPIIMPGMLASAPLPNVIGVGQLLESALHTAGEVAGTSVSTSPLPYGTMASQCEAFGMGTRKKLSSWLVGGHDIIPDDPSPKLHLNEQLRKINTCIADQTPLSSEPWLALRLPPASPFDNFMKAAGC